MRNFLTLHTAAVQIKYLISAVARIEGKKCPLSISQIKRLLDLGESLQRFYISKYDGSITTQTPYDESLYICIFITYVDEDAYLLKII